MVVQRQSRHTRQKRTQISRRRCRPCAVMPRPSRIIGAPSLSDPACSTRSLGSRHVCKLWISTPRLLPATKHYSPPRRSTPKLISAWPRSLRDLAIRTKAVLRYRDALAADPDFAEASFQIGHATDCERQAGGGNSTFPRCARRRPGLCRGLCGSGSRFHAQARRATTRPLRPSSRRSRWSLKNDDAHVGLAKIFDRKRRYVEAIDHLPRGACRETCAYRGNGRFGHFLEGHRPAMTRRWRRRGECSNCARIWVRPPACSHPHSGGNRDRLTKP